MAIHRELSPIFEIDIEARRLEREAIVEFLRARAQAADFVDECEALTLRQVALAIERQEHKG